MRSGTDPQRAIGLAAIVEVKSGGEELLQHIERRPSVVNAGLARG